MANTPLNNKMFRAGSRAANGFINVYVSGTSFTTLATVWGNQDKTSTIPNPVPLDLNGEAEIWFDVKIDYSVQDADLASLYTVSEIEPDISQVSSAEPSLLTNGSFEESESTLPLNWTLVPETNATIAVDTTNVRHGEKSLKFSGGGNGGGTATSLKFPVRSGSVITVDFSFYGTHAATSNVFNIRWYTETGAASSIPSDSMDVPASGSVPTSWTDYNKTIEVPSDATQGEAFLIGISSSGGNLSESAYFDGITISEKKPVWSLEASPTSGTVQEFTVPANAEQIKVSFFRLTASSQSAFQIQMGYSGSYETSGIYRDSYLRKLNTTVSGGVGNTIKTDFYTAVSTVDTDGSMSGIIDFVNVTGNNWTKRGVTNIQDDSAATLDSINFTSGDIALTGKLTRFKITCVGGFTGGTIRVYFK